MEPWQRWSMRGTENPENEVRVLGVPQEYMVSVAQMEERRVVAPVTKGSIPFRHTRGHLHQRMSLFLCHN